MALNHSYLRAIASLPLDQAVARLGSLRRLRERAPSQLFRTDPCQVHRGFGAIIVDPKSSPPLTLIDWLTNPPGGDKSLIIRFRQEAAWLLAHTRGPFWNDLPLLHEALQIEPEVASADPHVQELLRHLLGHVSNLGAAPLCAVSPDDTTNLTQPEYRSQFNGRQFCVSNLRHVDDFARVQDRQGEHSVSFSCAADVLRYAETESQGALKVLPSAFDSAHRFPRWEQRLTWIELLRCLIGLVHFKAARDDGLNDKEAMDRYNRITGVGATEESRFTMAKQACKEARTFTLPDGRAVVFEPHAKPLNRKEPRIHFYWDRQPGQASIVFIGHCGEHLPT